MTRPVIIAGGGTAGHVNPALDVGRALRDRGEDVRFVGSARGQEATLVPVAGFPVTLLPGRGVVRKVSWRAAVAIGGIAAATIRAFWLVRTWRPGAVLSMGGYASVPCTLAAAAWRVPVVLAEANAVPGAANKLASRWAHASAVSFEHTGLRGEVLTGNPVHAEVLAVSRAPEARAAARAPLGIPEGRVVIAVTGGSLGARSVNTAVRALAERWAARTDVAIHHAVGSRDWPTFVAPPTAGLHYTAVEYEQRIPELLSAADLWIGRAGGTTIAELTAVGVASLLVPLPIAPHDHQAVGARRLEAAGGCIVVLDSELSADRLEAEVGSLIADHTSREAMATAAARFGHHDAADRIASLVQDVARA